MDILEIGRYKGDTGWDGWIKGDGWISFIRPGEVRTYKLGQQGVEGEPSICKI